MLNLRRILQLFSKAKSEGIIEVTTEDDRLDGRLVTVHGRRVINFASCSYLGLEHDPRLKRAVIDSVERYGTQFSASRSYLSAPQYAEVEALLERICKRPVLVTPTTSLGHQAALPVLIREGDMVVLDRHVHNSVRVACRALAQRGVEMRTLAHDHFEQLEQTLVELESSHRRVWYLMDGLYSMHGTHAPMDEIDRLLHRYPRLHLYCDDAHSTGWCGRDGEGMALSRWARHPRVYVALSLNKSFAGAGGVITFPDRRSMQLVRHLGEPMIFSGPIQPPMLGAIAASARIHLSAELAGRQEQLLNRIRHFNSAATGAKLGMMDPGISPIRYIEIGSGAKVIEVSRKLIQRGFFVSCAIYPAVPDEQSGLRISLTNHLELEDIDALVATIVEITAAPPAKAVPRPRPTERSLPLVVAM